MSIPEARRRRLAMSAIEDGAMQDKAGAQIVTRRNHKDDPAYKELRQGTVCASDQSHVADWIDRLYAELTRLRERNAELEKERDEARRESVSKNEAMLVDASRITSLEAQLEAFRVALEAVRSADMRKAGCNSEDAIEYDGPVGKIAAGALMSALRMEERG